MKIVYLPCRLCSDTLFVRSGQWGYARPFSPRAPSPIPCPLCVGPGAHVYRVGAVTFYRPNLYRRPCELFWIDIFDPVWAPAPPTTVDGGVCCEEST